MHLQELLPSTMFFCTQNIPKRLRLSTHLPGMFATKSVILIVLHEQGDFPSSFWNKNIEVGKSYQLSFFDPLSLQM